MAACIIRAIWSDAPPAPAATTISTGLLGSQAPAGAAASAIVSAAAPPRQMFLISGIASSSSHGAVGGRSALARLSLARSLPLCACGARALAVAGYEASADPADFRFRLILATRDLTALPGRLREIFGCGVRIRPQMYRDCPSNRLRCCGPT